MKHILILLALVSLSACSDMGDVGKCYMDKNGDFFKIIIETNSEFLVQYKNGSRNTIYKDDFHIRGIADCIFAFQK